MTLAAPLTGDRTDDVPTGRDLPVLRLLPAPATEPPYDDEPGAAPLLRLVTAPVPAPRLVPVPAPGRQPADPTATPPGGPGVAGRGRDLPDEDAAPRTPTAELSCPRVFAHALVQRLLEVCAGVRPVTQLQRSTTPELYAALEAAVLARPRPSGLRPTRRDVRSVHVQDRPDGVAEACATVRRDGRVGALALRLEGVGGQWLCTELLGV